MTIFIMKRCPNQKWLKINCSINTNNSLKTFYKSSRKNLLWKLKKRKILKSNSRLTSSLKERRKGKLKSKICNLIYSRKHKRTTNCLCFQKTDTTCPNNCHFSTTISTWFKSISFRMEKKLRFLVNCCKCNRWRKGLNVSKCSGCSLDS